MKGGFKALNTYNNYCVVCENWEWYNLVFIDVVKIDYWN